MANKINFESGNSVKVNKGDKIQVTSKEGETIYYRVTDFTELPNKNWNIEAEKIGISK